MILSSLGGSKDHPFQWIQFYGQNETLSRRRAVHEEPNRYIRMAAQPEDISRGSFLAKLSKSTTQI